MDSQSDIDGLSDSSLEDSDKVEKSVETFLDAFAVEVLTMICQLLRIGLLQVQSVGSFPEAFVKQASVKEEPVFNDDFEHYDLMPLTLAFRSPVLRRTCYTSWTQSQKKALARLCESVTTVKLIVDEGVTGNGHYVSK